MAAQGESGSEDQRYFLAIEKEFIHLRGAPLLLSPTDWQQARDWRQTGIPLDLVLRTLREIFEKRRERGGKGSISSLRYCQRAVREAWEAAQELSLTAVRQTAPSLDVAVALQALAKALPAEVPDRSRFVSAILAAGDEPQEAEEQLAILDQQLLSQIEENMEGAERSRFEEDLQATVRKLSQRLPEEQVSKARQRLRNQKLRGLLGAPVLSLFSIEDLG